MTIESATPSRTKRAVARVVGYVLVLTFAGLAETRQGFFVRFPSLFTDSSPGELWLWLAMAGLLFPAACLLGYGFGPQMKPVLARVSGAIDAMTPRAYTVAVCFVCAVVVAAYRLGDRFVLLDYPVTDDENAAKVGGQILATGHALIPQFQPYAAYPSLFMFAKNGAMTAMDWPGVQFVWALGHIVRAEHLVFAIGAAVPIVFVALLVSRNLGRAWGVLAATFVLFSPMDFALSMTTHAHIFSRAFLAMALCAYVMARELDRSILWSAAGVCVGAAFICRPFETAFLALPFVAIETFRLVRDFRVRLPAALAFASGALPLLAVLLVHSWAVTGNPLLPARLSPDSSVNAAAPLTVWQKFGTNSGYNLFLLTIWFLGPLGTILVAFGAMVNELTKTLATSVASVIALGLFHTNTGIHAVGPIHYSECVVPLAVLATFGAFEVKRRLADLGLSFASPAATIAFTLVITLVPFSAIHAVGLRRSAEIQRDIYAEIDRLVDPSAGKAVVLAPKFGGVWYNLSSYATLGTWVFEWRKPKIDYSDDVLILHDAPGVEGPLRDRFPDRRFFRLETKANALTIDRIP